MFNGSSNNLRVVAKLYNNLQILNLTAEEITQIASHNGGSLNVEAVVEHYQVLMQSGFKHSDIITMASFPQGGNTLDSLKAYAHALEQLGFSKANLTRIATRVGGGKIIKAIHDCAPLLSQGRLSIEEILKRLEHNNVVNELYAMYYSMETEINLTQPTSLYEHFESVPEIESQKSQTVPPFMLASVQSPLKRAHSSVSEDRKSLKTEEKEGSQATYNPLFFALGKAENHQEAPYPESGTAPVYS